jgi:hypothetical protein
MRHAVTGSLIPGDEPEVRGFVCLVRWSGSGKSAHPQPGTEALVVTSPGLPLAQATLRNRPTAKIAPLFLPVLIFGMNRISYTLLLSQKVPPITRY